MPLSGDVERRIRTLVHESHYSGPPPEATTLSPISATANVSPLMTYTSKSGMVYTLTMPPHIHTEHHFRESSGFSRPISVDSGAMTGTTGLLKILGFFRDPSAIR